MALDHGPPAHDRAPRRTRATRPVRPGGRALRRQPPGCLRRSVRAAVRRAARVAPRRRGGVVAAPVRPADAARDDRGRPRLLDQPVVRRPVPPAAMGLDVPGPARRPSRRLHRHGSRGRRRRWPRSVVASSRIAWAGRRPSRWPGRSVSPARSRMRACASGPRNDRRSSRLVNRSARCASGRSSARSPSPRGSTAAG